MSAPARRPRGKPLRPPPDPLLLHILPRRREKGSTRRSLAGRQKAGISPVPSTKEAGAGWRPRPGRAAAAGDTAWLLRRLRDGRLPASSSQISGVAISLAWWVAIFRSSLGRSAAGHGDLVLQIPAVSVVGSWRRGWRPVKVGLWLATAAPVGVATLLKELPPLLIRLGSWR